MHQYGNQYCYYNIPYVTFPCTGAWWLGYLIGGIPMVILIIPMFFFPRTMSPKEHASELTSNENGTSEPQLTENENRDIIDVVRTGAEKVGFVEVLRGKFLRIDRKYYYWAWDSSWWAALWFTIVNQLQCIPNVYAFCMDAISKMELALYVFSCQSRIFQRGNTSTSTSTLTHPTHIPHTPTHHTLLQQSGTQTSTLWKS